MNFRGCEFLTFPKETKKEKIEGKIHLIENEKAYQLCTKKGKQWGVGVCLSMIKSNCDHYCPKTHNIEEKT